MFNSICLCQKWYDEPWNKTLCNLDNFAYGHDIVGTHDLQIAALLHLFNTPVERVGHLNDETQ